MIASKLSMIWIGSPLIWDAHGGQGRPPQLNMEVDVNAHSLFYTEDDLFFDARRIVTLIRDPRSNAKQVSRLVEQAPQLDDAVNACAREHFRGRGRVQSTVHAVTLIGYRRLEQVIRSVVQQAYLQLRDGDMAASPAMVQPPMVNDTGVKIAI